MALHPDRLCSAIDSNGFVPRGPCPPAGVVYETLASWQYTVNDDAKRTLRKRLAKGIPPDSTDTPPLFAYHRLDPSL